jgi:hypothetical protein
MALAFLYFDCVRSDRQGRKQGGAGCPTGGLVAFFIFAELVKKYKNKNGQMEQKSEAAWDPKFIFSIPGTTTRRLCGTPGIFPVLTRSRSEHCRWLFEEDHLHGFSPPKSEPTMWHPMHIVAMPLSRLCQA